MNSYSSYMFYLFIEYLPNSASREENVFLSHLKVMAQSPKQIAHQYLEKTEPI